MDAPRHTVDQYRRYQVSRIVLFFGILIGFLTVFTMAQAFEGALRDAYLVRWGEGKAPSIRVDWNEEKDRIVVRVADQGIGKVFNVELRRF